MTTSQDDMLPLPAYEMDKDADVAVTRRPYNLLCQSFSRDYYLGWGGRHPDTWMELKGQLPGELRLPCLDTRVPT